MAGGIPLRAVVPSGAFAAAAAPLGRRPPSPGPSILWTTEPGGSSTAAGAIDAAVLADLRLDQVLGSLTAGREEYALDELFVAGPVGPATARFRQRSVEDLTRPALQAAVRAFVSELRDVRLRLGYAERRHHPLQVAGIQLEAARRYVGAVSALDTSLATGELDSPGFRDLRSFVRSYTSGRAFGELAHEAAAVERALREIVYVVHLRDRRVEVLPFHGTADYGAEVEATFERFAASAASEYRFRWHDGPDLSPVEGEVLDRVALLFPEPFRRLRLFVGGRASWLDPVLTRFERESQFLLAYLDLTARLAARSLPCALPELVDAPGVTEAVGSFDLALGLREPPTVPPVVTNDVELRSPERLLVVTGPNQGGKTTFARAFGQLHYLAALGLPVPARSARLSLPDRVFTHFGREEHAADERGRLQDDLLRLRAIVDACSPASVVVMNESFASATLEDARRLGAGVLERLIVRGARGVFVTFVDELSRLGPNVVSLVAGVSPDDPNRRTFRVERRAADGKAYARAVAEQHGLDRPTLEERIRR